MLSTWLGIHRDILLLMVGVGAEGTIVLGRFVVCVKSSIWVGLAILPRRAGVGEVDLMEG